MSKIEIWNRRYHDGAVLIADYRIEEDNQLHLLEARKDGTRRFPVPLYVNGTWAKTFPLEMLKTKKGGEIPVRAIPLDEILKEVIQL